MFVQFVHLLVASLCDGFVCDEFVHLLVASLCDEVCTPTGS